MRLKPIILLITTIGILLAIKFIFFPTPDPAAQKGGPGGKPKGLEAVLTDGFVARRDTTNRSLSLSGSLLATEESDLHPEVSGKVTGIYFKEGQKVTKGKLLVKIQDSELQANLERTRQEYLLGKQKLERQAKLLKIGGVSQEEYESTQAQVNAASAGMDAIRAQIERTEIKAPFTGTIGLRSVSEGSFVTPQMRIASIQQIDSLKIDFTVPSRYAQSVATGTKFTFRTETGTEEFEGIVRAIEPKIDEGTRTVLVRGVALNKQANLVPGSFVNISLPLGKNIEGYMIPAEAIIPTAKGKKVFVSDHGKAAEREVVTGERYEKEILVIEGIKEGDTLLTSGLMSMRNGVNLRFRRVR